MVPLYHRSLRQLRRRRSSAAARHRQSHATVRASRDGSRRTGHPLATAVRPSEDDNRPVEDYEPPAAACSRPWSGKCQRTPARSTAPRSRCNARQPAAEGAKAQAIGRSRGGGGTTKIQVIGGSRGSPFRCSVTPGAFASVAAVIGENGFRPMARWERGMP